MILQSVLLISLLSFQQGDWHVSQSTSGITNEAVTTISLPADNNSGTLVIQRIGKLWVVAVKVDNVVDVPGFDGQYTTLYKLDNKTRMSRWFVTSDRQGIYVSGSDAEKFISKLAIAETFSVEITLLRGGAITPSFTLKGLKQKLDAQAQSNQQSKPSNHRIQIDAFDLTWAGTIIGDKISTDYWHSHCSRCYEQSVIKNDWARMGAQFGLLGATKYLEARYPDRPWAFRIFKGAIIALITVKINQNFQINSGKMKK